MIRIKSLLMVSLGTTAGLCSAQSSSVETLLASVTPPMMVVADFESGGLEGWNISRQNAPVVTRDAPRSGAYALKSSLDYHDSAQRERTEVRAIGSDAQVGQEYWYGFSINLPPSYVADDVWEIVAQWYALPDQPSEASRNPPLQLNTSGGRWGITNKWDSKALTPDKHYEGGRSFDLGPYQVGEWTDWVFHVKWSYGNDGVLQVWKNGQLVVNETGPNTYNDSRGPFFKMGIYKGWKKIAPDKVMTRTIYHDEFRMAGADGVYADVAPATQIAPLPPSLIIVE